MVPSSSHSLQHSICQRSLQTIITMLAFLQTLTISCLHSVNDDHKIVTTLLHQTNNIVCLFANNIGLRKESRDNCVSLISSDFSKAFDSVSHLSLSHKLSVLALSDTIHIWISSFESFLKNSHKNNRKDVSSSLHVHQRHCSPGLRSASDVIQVCRLNAIVKYAESFADDTWILVPS